MTITAKDLNKSLTGILGENAEASGVKAWLDTGIPELNYMLSQDYHKGAPEGRVIEIFGPSSSGKTFLATQLMASAQRKGGIAFFSDYERSFDPAFAKTLGMDIDPSVFKHLKPKTFEESIDKFQFVAHQVREAGLPMNVPCIWVIDSVAAAVPHSKIYDEKGNRREVGSYKMNDHLALAKSCSQSYPVLKQTAEDCNFSVLLLNQIRMKPGVMYGDPRTTPGGQAAEFYADIRVSLGKSDIVDKKTKEHEGFKIKAKAVKNKLARPNASADWQIRFNQHGKFGVTVDQIGTNVDYLKRLGIIEMNGTRINWDGKSLYEKQLVEMLRQDPDGNKKLMDLLESAEEE